MNKKQPDPREERALDALMAAVIRQPEDVSASDEEIREFLNAPKPLSAEAQAAIKRLGSNVVENLVLRAGHAPSRTSDVAVSDELYAAMNRKNKSGKHDPKTEEELERKRKEILDRLKKKKRGKDKP